MLLLHSANVRVNEVRLLSFLGDVEIGSSGGDPKLQVLQQRKQQKAFVCRTSGAIELQEGFGRWCAGMVWKWVRELANARTHSRSECGDGHDMNSVGVGVGGGRTTENHNERFRRSTFGFFGDGVANGDKIRRRRIL